MEISQLASQIQDSYAQDEQSGDSALFSVAADAYESGAIQSGDLDQLLEMAGTAAGIAACSASGAAALAPLCAAAGKTAGQLVSTFFGGGAKPGGSDGFDAHPWGELMAAKDKALGTILSLSGGDTAVAAQLRKTIQVFYPFSYETKNGQTFAKLDQEPGVPYTALPLAGGYMFSVLSPYDLSPLDFKYVVDQYGVKTPVLKREPGWVNRLVMGLIVPMRMGTTLQLDAVAQAVNGDLGTDPPGGAQAVVDRLKLYLFPILDAELKRRVSNVIQVGKIQRQARLIKLLEETTAQLQKIHGWTATEARAMARELAATIQEGNSQAISEAVQILSTNLAGQVSDAAKKGIFKTPLYGWDLVAKAPKKNEKQGHSGWFWAGVFVVGSATMSAAGLVAWRVSKKKPPIPSSFRHPLR